MLAVIFEVVAILVMTISDFVEWIKKKRAAKEGEKGKALSNKSKSESMSIDKGRGIFEKDIPENRIIKSEGPRSRGNHPNQDLGEMSQIMDNKANPGQEKDAESNLNQFSHLSQHPGTK